MIHWWYFLSTAPLRTSCLCGTNTQWLWGIIGHLCVVKDFFRVSLIQAYFASTFLLINFIGGKLTLLSFHISTKTFAANRFWSSSGSPMGTRKQTFFFWGFMSLGPCLLWSCFVAVTSCLPKSKPGPPSYRHRDLFVCLPLFSFF